MKKFSFVLTLLVVVFSAFSQTTDSLIVHYYENFPYSYNEGTRLRGIEIEIVQEYVKWLKEKKGITLIVTYKQFKEFSAFYNSVKDGGPQVIGLGSVTNNPEREKEVTFSPPYLRNVAVLITAGTVPTIKNKTREEAGPVFGSMTAMVVNKSTHIRYIDGLKNIYANGLKVQYTETQNKVLESIVSDSKNLGYVDIVAYWSFLKNNSSKFLKIQKQFNEPNEYLSFAMPKKNTSAVLLSEFFEGGFGFTSTKVYHQILEGYLGHEIIESVEIQ